MTWINENHKIWCIYYKPRFNPNEKNELEYSGYTLQEEMVIYLYDL